MLAEAQAAAGITPQAGGTPGVPPAFLSPGMMPGASVPGADPAAPVDYSAQAALLLNPAQATEAQQPAAPQLPAGVTPGVLAVSQNILSRYGSAEAFDAALEQQKVAGLKEDAKTAIAAQWAPAYEAIDAMETAALAVADESDHAAIKANAEAARGRLDPQFAAAVTQAEQFAELRPALDELMATRQRTQHEAQINAQVAQVLGAAPQLQGIPGMDTVLKNSIMAGKDAQTAVAEALQMANNLGIRAAQQGGGVQLPPGTAYALPPANIAPGQHAAGIVNMPNPVTDPAGFKAFEAQVLAGVRR
jgi:hypothetical protein